MTELITQGSLADPGFSTMEMKNRLDSMVQKLDLMQEFFKRVMVADQDFGVIPGTQKPTLYKAGAEKLNELYNYSPTVRDVDEDRDTNSGFYRAKVIIAIIERRTGLVVAEGVGEANSFEGRYRWRWCYERDLPPGINSDSCVFKEYTGKNGPYKKYRIENDDMFSLWNTVLKMAKKRSLVDATLSATRSAGLFTQDLEDLNDWIGEEPDETDGKRHRPGKKEDKPTQPIVQVFCEGPDCQGKNKSLSEAQVKFSKNKFGKSLCMNCQKKEAEYQALLAEQENGK